MAPCPKGPRNRLKITTMKKTFYTKIECLNHRLKKWSKVFKKPVFTFTTRDNNFEESFEIMPVEKYFDYLMDIHVVHTDHGDIKKMMKAIREEGLWMPYEAVYVFHKVCSKCSLMRKTHNRKDAARRARRNILNQVTNTGDEIHRMRGFVEIIDMRSKPDGEYKYILHYRDLSTKFSRLRPLKNPLASEVAHELFPIFMTSGAPAILHTPVKTTFTAAIIKNLEPLMPDVKILVGNRRASRKKEDRIPDLLDKYLANIQWSIGIYYVETDMNNNKRSRRISAYEAMFDKKPGTGLIKRFSNQTSRSLYKKLQNEEDLLLPMVEKYVMGSGEELATLSSEDVKMGTEWCAVCGNDLADSSCGICGVAIHLKCNTDEQRFCDCCMTTTVNHKHDLLPHNVKFTTKMFNLTQSINASVTETQSDNVDKTKVLTTVNVNNVDITKELTTVNVASTSAQPDSKVNLTNDGIQLKVGKIVGQYSKRKKPNDINIITMKKPLNHDNNTQSGKDRVNSVKDDAAYVKTEVVEVKTEPVDVGNEPVDVGNESVTDGNYSVNVKQEIEMDVVKTINVFDEKLDIVKNEPL